MSISHSSQLRIQTFLVTLLETLILKLFYWETEPARIGKLIRWVHHAGAIILAMLIFLNHTLYQSYFLFVCLYFFMFLIWAHHILTGGCIISKLEQRLIGDHVSFTDPFLEFLHIPITEESSSGLVLLMSSIIFMMLSLEFMSRTISGVQGLLHR
jgi:hypothetical protein